MSLSRFIVTKYVSQIIEYYIYNKVQMSFNSADTRMEKHQSESKHYSLGPPNKETMMANALWRLQIEFAMKTRVN